MSNQKSKEEIIQHLLTKLSTLSKETKNMTLSQLWEQRGYERGIGKGIQDGKLEEKNSIAKKLLASGLNFEFICEITGLKIEQVKNLRDTL